MKKSLKINKQNITLSITKGSLLSIFQFCIHLMNFTFSRLFYLYLFYFILFFQVPYSRIVRIRIFPCSSGSGRLFLLRIRAHLGPKHC